MEVKEGKKEAWAVRCEGGPFDGRDAFIGIEPKGKQVRVFESILMEGSLMHDEKIDELFPGDALYEEMSRSQLPEGVPHVMRGGTYKFVKAGPDKDDDDVG